MHFVQAVVLDQFVHEAVEFVSIPFDEGLGGVQLLGDDLLGQKQRSFSEGALTVFDSQFIEGRTTGPITTEDQEYLNPSASGESEDGT